mmetsp:Transcript_55563/g.165196  ORF Transcript_55563/g.165196 Transcript_55563/m.165196 type:complete len:271 (-) Transcript_55563:380-1192(-)
MLVVVRLKSRALAFNRVLPNVAAGDQSSFNIDRVWSGGTGAVVGMSWTLECLANTSGLFLEPMLCSKRSDGTGMEARASETSLASRISAAAGGQPGSTLRGAPGRNSSPSSTPVPCSRTARPAKSESWVTSSGPALRTGLASSSLRWEQLFADRWGWLSRTGCPDIAMSLSVWACRARKLARMSARRSCSISVQTCFHISSLSILAVIICTASRSRSRTLAVSTFRSSFSGFSSRPPSNVSWLLWTSRRARLWGAQEEACSKFTRSSFLL